MKAKWVILSAIVLLWIAGTIGIAMQMSQTVPPPGSTHFVETFKTVLLLLGGLGVILPTYLGVWQSIENNQVIEQRLRFDEVNNSFDLVQKWDDASLLAARKFTRELKVKRPNLSDNDLLKEIDGNPDLKQSVVLVFNYFEQIRVSVFYGRANEAILKESLCAIFVDLYDRFLPWIKTYPQAYQDDLKALYKRWHQA